MGLLDGKVITVTSSTQGIGLACAQTLAGHGAQVYYQPTASTTAQPSQTGSMPRINRLASAHCTRGTQIA